MMQAGPSPTDSTTSVEIPTPERHCAAPAISGTSAQRNQVTRFGAASPFKMAWT
jgi:hypothetical protein